MSDAVGRGPNYNWEHEARHYREEADDLRKLLRLVERSGEKASLENAALRADLKWIAVYAEDLFREGDKGYQIAIFARESLNKKD